MSVKHLIIFFACTFLCKGDAIESQVSQLIDDVDNQQELYLFGGLTIEKFNNVSVEDVRSSSTLIERIDRYLKTHTLKYEVPELTTLENGKCNKL